MLVEFTFVPVNSNGPLSAAEPFFYDPSAARTALTGVQGAGFGAVVIDENGGILTNFDVAASVARHASSLRVVMTHWAGTIDPTVAAGQIAALEARCGGRLELRIVPDGRMGAGHVEAWQRTDEYLTLLKRLWTNDKPFDHEGPFYSVRRGQVQGKSGALSVPIRIGGRSGTALQVAGRHADIFELAPGTPDETRQLIERVRTVAGQYGRAAKIGFALPVHLSSGATPRQKDCEMHPAATATAQAAVSLLSYVDAGVTEFMISGSHGSADLRRFSSEIIPVLRNSVERRSRTSTVSGAEIGRHSPANDLRR